MNPQVIERIMRMGIEHRAGIPLEELHSLAEKQLATKRPQPSKSTFSSLQEWFEHNTATHGRAYALIYTNNKPSVQVISSLNELATMSFKGWNTLGTIPVLHTQ